MVDIYSILSSKPNNSHYLKRYYNFILLCEEKNKNLNLEIYTEFHHICPKAKDLFPEFKNSSLFEWNIIQLTARQHIIAHILLSKSYGGSQTQVLYFMFSGVNSNERQFVINTKKYDTKYYAKLKEQFSSWRKNKSTFIDSDGNKYFIETNDPIIQELSLVGNNLGITHSEESKQQMRDTKKKVRLYKGLKSILVLERFPKLIEEKIAEGYSLQKDEELFKQKKIMNKLDKNKRQSEVMKGLCQHYYPDGTHYGMIYRDDPIIEELNLKPFKEENRQALIAICYKNHKDPIIQKKKSETMSKKAWYYDPISKVNYRLERDKNIPKNLIAGKYTNPETKIKKITINNGETNKMIIPSQLPEYLDLGWSTGMKPRKQKVS